MVRWTERPQPADLGSLSNRATPPTPRTQFARIATSVSPSAPTLVCAPRARTREKKQMHARLASRGDHRVRHILLASARAAFASAAGSGTSIPAAPAQGGTGTGAAAAAQQNDNGAATSTVANRSFYRFNAPENRDAAPPGDRNASASASSASPTAAGNVSGRIVGSYNATAQRNVSGGFRSRFAPNSAPARAAGMCDWSLMDKLCRVKYRRYVQEQCEIQRLIHRPCIVSNRPICVCICTCLHFASDPPHPPPSSSLRPGRAPAARAAHDDAVARGITGFARPRV